MPGPLRLDDAALAMVTGGHAHVQTGGSGNDDFLAYHDNDVIQGHDGNDTVTDIGSRVYGASDHDRIDGGAGQDSLEMYASPDELVVMLQTPSGPVELQPRFDSRSGSFVYDLPPGSQATVTQGDRVIDLSSVEAIRLIG